MDRRGYAANIAAVEYTLIGRAFAVEAAGRARAVLRAAALVVDTEWHRRLLWVRRQGSVNWSPDPYKQLASYYTAMGDEAAAKRVQVAKQDDELIRLRDDKKTGHSRLPVLAATVRVASGLRLSAPPGRLAASRPHS
jgi:hypothetical protein